METMIEMRFNLTWLYFVYAPCPHPRQFLITPDYQIICSE